MADAVNRFETCLWVTSDKLESKKSTDETLPIFFERVENFVIPSQNRGRGWEGMEGDWSKFENRFDRILMSLI